MGKGGGNGDFARGHGRRHSVQMVWVSRALETGRLLGMNVAPQQIQLSKEKKVSKNQRHFCVVCVPPFLRLPCTEN